ncbi:MAG: MBOAT family O-acyltransferase [Eubacteriales bacterium]
MVFSSTTFLFIFLPIVFLAYIPLGPRLRNILLLFASLIFYAWGEPLFVFVMLASIGINYAFARWIEGGKTEQAKRTFVAIAVILNLLLLIVFKYTNFIIDNVNTVLNTHIEVAPISLPIGISFFTFQAMSYIVDVYREKNRSEKSILNVALYISFFPQLIAGPIVKYHDIAEQIHKRTMTTDKVFYGLRRFIVGLSKKLLIANTVGQAADSIFAAAPAELSAGLAWLGAVSYALQIYFDFSGYSDMAIGLASLFGFELKENFNYPYISQSIKEFWRRWHISLSTWFKEYLYIPLGGNRNGYIRTGVNMFIVFLCTGIWHGAAWNFVIWGLFNGLFLLLENYKILQPEKWPRVFRHIYAALVFVIGFTIFRAPSMTDAISYIGSMFSGNLTLTSRWLYAKVGTPFMWSILVVAIVATMPLIPKLKEKMAEKRKPLFDQLAYVLTLVLLVLCILNISSSTFNPFIYFRF